MRVITVIILLSTLFGINIQARAADLPQTCRTASECTGPLPQICEVCSDGFSRCAHWTCTPDHKCVTEICPSTRYAPPK
jgi:hypothetical protein